MIEIIPNWHPVFVHFPIAFATAAVFFFTAAQLFKEKSWAAQSLLTGRWMLWSAAIFACIAVVFGWFAYNSVDHDEAGHLAMTAHRNWALVAVGVLVMLAALDVWLRRFTAATPSGFLALLVVSWLLIINAAWHGGEVVYRHGLGVMSLPKSEGAGHPHEHGAGHGDDHALSHEDMAKGTGVPPKEAEHTHAPGTPAHKD
jgi:uncharacterized membrane protein